MTGEHADPPADAVRAEATTRDEWAEWEALDARVGAWESGEAPPLPEADEARYGALLDRWPEARECAASVARLHLTIQPEHRPEALRGTLAMMRALHTRLGLPVPLWIGLAQDRLDHGDE